MAFGMEDNDEAAFLLSISNHLGARFFLAYFYWNEIMLVFPALRMSRERLSISYSIYLPLFMMIIGSFSIANEMESGQWQLLCTYPVSIPAYLSWEICRV